MITPIKGNAHQSFSRYTDQDGNYLCGFNKDGSVGATAIAFSDGTTQNTAGGGSVVQTSVVDIPVATMRDFGTGTPTIEIIPGVPDKIIIPVSITVIVNTETKLAYSGNSTVLTHYDGGQNANWPSLQSGTFSSFDEFGVTILNMGGITDYSDVAAGITGKAFVMDANGAFFNGGQPSGPYTPAAGGQSYAPGDTGRWGEQQGFSYTVLTVNGSGAVLTFSVSTPSSVDWAFAGANSTSASTGIGFGFQINVPTVAMGDAPVRFISQFIVTDVQV
jgi:hypothetical protein